MGMLVSLSFLAFALPSPPLVGFGATELRG